MGFFDDMKKKVTDTASQAYDSVSDSARSISEKIEERGVSGLAGDAISSSIDAVVDVHERLVDNYNEIANTDLETCESYCSWCNQKTTATLIEKNTVSRNVYQCNSPQCIAEQNKVVQCRVCSNKARFNEGWGFDGHYCAVHAGEIANFKHLNDKLDDITKFHRIVERDDVNMVRLTKTAAVVAGGAVVIGPLAYWAAPAVGGAVGSFMGLSGAAASNAGLAALGGGALAAGGAGMAGGTVVVSAVGAALGGRMGGVVSNSYFSDIDGFKIRKIRDGSEPALMCIDGFLTQGVDTDQEWLSNLPESFKDRAVYIVDWEAKRLRDLATMFSVMGVKQAVAHGGIKGLVLKASKLAAKRVGPVANVLMAADLIDNPWHVARYKAEETGVLLADLIARTEQKFVLVGHSLGARVIYCCLSALRTVKDKTWIDSVYLLGGAVNNSVSDKDESGINWAGIGRAVDGSVFNCYSTNDDVLKYLYNVSQLFQGSSIGRNPVNSAEVTNVDVTSVIGGHTEYKKNLKEVIARTQN